MLQKMWQDIDDDHTDERRSVFYAVRIVRQSERIEANSYFQCVVSIVLRLSDIPDTAYQVRILP